MPHQAFDTKKYLKSQIVGIHSRVAHTRDKLYIEFGGKIMHDKHAARVLPGYDENAKLFLMKRLCGSQKGEIIFVISAKDILRKRIRGDFKITYDKEAMRVLRELALQGLRVRNVVVSLVPHGPIPQAIKKFKRDLERRKMRVFFFHAFEQYTKGNFHFSTLEQNPFVPTRGRVVIIASPGGGSGKFGVCLSQLYYEMKRGVEPQYLKFETFPVHNLPLEHPLNLAYMAASADFYDIVMKDRRHGSATSYNRDIENYELLHRLARRFRREGTHLRKVNSATDMGMNRITDGIVDDEEIQKEAAAEIARRLVRYKFEVDRGQEDPQSLTRTRTILRML